MCSTRTSGWQHCSRWGRLHQNDTACFSCCPFFHWAREKSPGAGRNVPAGLGDNLETGSLSSSGPKSFLILTLFKLLRGHCSSKPSYSSELKYFSGPCLVGKQAPYGLLQVLWWLGRSWSSTTPISVLCSPLESRCSFTKAWLCTGCLASAYCMWRISESRGVF